jgi:hypothetical protein
VRDKPQYCFDSGCPMAEKGRGFALGCGPQNAAISILFERPAEDELSFILDTTHKPDGMSAQTWATVKAWRQAEIDRRRQAYPDLELRFLLRGAPVRGASGAELQNWALPMAGGGVNLEDCFLENVLHCAAPAGADEKDMYPKGDERIRAESCCAHWNRLLPLSARDNIKLYADERNQLSGLRQEELQKHSADDASSKRLSVQEMPIVRQEIQTSSGRSTGETSITAHLEDEKILQQGLRTTSVERAEKSSMERRSALSGSIPIRLLTKSSTSAQTQSVRSGASTSDGEKTEKISEKRRNSSSPERDKGRQSSKESGIDGQESTRRQNTMPILPWPIPDSITVSLVSLHPAGLLKDKGGGIVSLPLQADTFKKAKTYSRIGKKVLVLAGGKAAKFWNGFGETVTKWCGHYSEETEETWRRRLERIQEGLSIKLTASGRRTKKSTTTVSAEELPLKPKRTRRKKPDLRGMDPFGVI